MSTIGSLYVDIGATTEGFTRSMRETTTAMDRLAQSGVEVEVGLDSSRALRDVETLKKKVQSSSASIGGGVSPTINLDSFEEVADILIEGADEFEAKMVKAIDLMLAKLKTATIGNSRGANLFVALLKDSFTYVGRLGEAKVAWETVRDAELRAGKTAEEAHRSADIWQASAVARSTSGIQKVIKGLTAIRDRTIDSLKPFTEFKPTTLMLGIEEMGKKFGVVGKIAGKAFNVVVDVGGKAINFIGNNIGKIAGVLVVAGGAVYASWKAISGLLSVIAGVASVIGSIFSAFGSVIAGIGDLFGAVIDIVGSLAESLGAVIGALYEVGSAIVAQVYAPFDYVFGKIGDLWGSVYDTIMGGFSSIKGYILGALTTATMLWLGKLAWDSGVFGRGLSGLEAMLNGGTSRVIRKDASGADIDEGGVLQKVAEKSSASIKRFFDMVQKMFGRFFSTTTDVVGYASDKVSMAVDWITSQLQSWITVAINVAISFIGLIDSTIGIFLAMFQGDWSGAGAMALDVVAQVTDGLVSIIGLISPALNWVTDNVGWLIGQVLTFVGTQGKGVEMVVQSVLGQILDIVVDLSSWIVDAIATGVSAVTSMMDAVAKAINLMNKAMSYTPTGMAMKAMGLTQSPLADNTTETVLGSLYGATGSAFSTGKITAGKLGRGEYGSVMTDEIQKLGEVLVRKGNEGFNVSKLAEDALSKLAEGLRGKRDELSPDAMQTYGGITAPIVKQLEELKSSLGLGNVVEGKGRVIDNDQQAQDLANGGANTLSVETALGTVKLAGSFDKTAMIAKNALTEAQRQTMILQQTQKILQDAGTQGERFVQVKDASGNDVSMNRLLTKLVTRQDINDPTKKTVGYEMLAGQDLEKRYADLALFAENQLGGSKDLSGINLSEMLSVMPTLLRDEVERSSAISTASKEKFASGGDPEQRKLTEKTNSLLEQIRKSKTASPFT